MLAWSPCKPTRSSSVRERRFHLADGHAWNHALSPLSLAHRGDRNSPLRTASSQRPGDSRREGALSPSYRSGAWPHIRSRPGRVWGTHRASARRVSPSRLDGRHRSHGRARHGCCTPHVSPLSLPTHAVRTPQHRCSTHVHSAFVRHGTTAPGAPDHRRRKRRSPSSRADRSDRARYRVRPTSSGESSSARGHRSGTQRTSRSRMSSTTAGTEAPLIGALMVGAGEYTTGCVFTASGPASDKPAGVIALCLLDLRRRGKVCATLPFSPGLSLLARLFRVAGVAEGRGGSYRHQDGRLGDGGRVRDQDAGGARDHAEEGVQPAFASAAWCREGRGAAISVTHGCVRRRGETWQIGDAYQGMDLTMTTLPADDVAFDAEAYKLAIKQMRKVRHTSACATNVRGANATFFLPHFCGGQRSKRERGEVHFTGEADAGTWPPGGRGDHLHTRRHALRHRHDVHRGGAARAHRQARREDVGAAPRAERRR